MTQLCNNVQFDEILKAISLLVTVFLQCKHHNTVQNQPQHFHCSQKPHQRITSSFGVIVTTWNVRPVLSTSAQLRDACRHRYILSYIKVEKS